MKKIFLFTIVLTTVLSAQKVFDLSQDLYNSSLKYRDPSGLIKLVKALGNNIDTTSVESLIAFVDTADIEYSQAIAVFLGRRGKTEAIPTITNRFHRELSKKSICIDYLSALRLFGTVDISNYMHQYIDTMMIDLKNKPHRYRFKYYSLNYALDCLWKMKDHTTYDDLKSITLNYVNDSTVDLDLRLFSAYYDLRPDLRSDIYSVMVALLQNPMPENRRWSQDILRLYLDSPETQALFQEQFNRETSEENKMWILLDRLRSKYDFEILGLAENLAMETRDSSVFKLILDVISDIPTPYTFIVLNKIRNAKINEPSFLRIVDECIDITGFYKYTPEKSVLILLDTLYSQTNQVKNLGWIGDDSYVNQLLQHVTNAKSSLLNGDSIGCKRSIYSYMLSIDTEWRDSTERPNTFIAKVGWKYLVGYGENIFDRLPSPAKTPRLNVTLKSSSGSNLTNGTLQYYEGSWKDATNNGDGTFNVSTTKPTISLRMTYEYGTEQKNNVTVGSSPVIFQTVNAQVKLQNSQGNPIDIGTVQYYAGAWRTFGTTINGTASKELLANNYSFRMTYAYGSNDKQQDLNVNPIVVFQTVNTAVQLKNSQGSFIDQGTVQYYSGAWRTFGTTTSGVATKELLPNNYSFRMTYAYGSNDKQQDLNTNSTVVFQTANAAVQLKNSAGDLIDQGTVQYYSGAWRDFGTTTNGIANKELLPNNYSFRMSYAYASKDKQQDVGANATVVFQTVNAVVQLKNSQGSLIDQGTVQYYSGAWRSFGTTSSGTASKELLPNSYQFRMTNEYVSNDKTQDVGVNNTVAFSTVSATVRVKNLQDNPVNGATVTYYSGAWRSIGMTPANGEISKELLPANLQFRAKLGSPQQDKTQNISTNPVVDIQLNINQ